MRVYLAGPIRFQKPEEYWFDVHWRADMDKFLKKQGDSGIIPSDLLPDTKNGNFKRGGKNAFTASKNNHLAFMREVMKYGHVGLIRDVTRKFFIEPDMAGPFKEGEAILAYVHEYSPGTICECWDFFKQGKPVWIVSSIPVTKMRPWLIGISSELFPNMGAFKRWYRTNRKALGP